MTRSVSKNILSISFILLGFMVVGSCEPKGDKKPMKVVLCIGQSNMAGRADIPTEDTIALNKVYLLNDLDKWEPAKNPLNRYSTIRKEMSMQRLSLAWTFSKTLSEKYPKDKFGLVVNVRGGSSIDSWGKGSHYYNEAVIRTLKVQRDGGQIIGIIWHQGEADRNKHEGYVDKFADMVKCLRTDLNNPDLPIVIGEIGDWNRKTVHSKSINKEIVSIPGKVPYVACVSVDGLMHKGDSLHFSTDAQHKLGKKYAEKFMEMVSMQ